MKNITCSGNRRSSRISLSLSHSLTLSLSLFLSLSLSFCTECGPPLIRTDRDARCLSAINWPTSIFHYIVSGKNTEVPWFPDSSNYHSYWHTISRTRFVASRRAKVKWDPNNFRISTSDETLRNAIDLIRFSTKKSTEWSLKRARLRFIPTTNNDLQTKFKFVWAYSDIKANNELCRHNFDHHHMFCSPWI